MNYGVIDIGANTVRLTVYDMLTRRQIASGVNYAGLIAYVDNGVMSRDGIDALCGAVSDMMKLCQENDCREVRAFATASLRDIKDKGALIREVRERCLTEIEIISGEEEARYDYLGLRMIYNVNTGAAFDLGGGSGQLITFANGAVTGFTSKRIGALRLYKDYVSETFPNKSEEEHIREYVRAELSDFKSGVNDFVFAMGGAATALSKLFSVVFEKNSDIFDVNEIRGALSIPQSVIEKVIPKRLYTIMPAVIAIDEICYVLKTNKIKTVSCGVREGVFSELFLKNH